MSFCSHPYNCIKSIPYSVGLRIKRNCSTDIFLDNRAKEYKNYLTEQGYSPRIVKEQFDKALSLDRKDLLKVKKKSRYCNIIPFVTDFNGNLPNISKIFKRNLHLLESTDQLKNIFSSKRIVTAYRRPKNLKEILAPSKLRETIAINTNNSSNDRVGCFKCNSGRCDLCKNYLQGSVKFTSFATKRFYHIKQELSCKSKNVIYLVSCNKCKLQYVGSTRNEFKVRFRNHKSSMLTKKKTCEVAIHFNSKPHKLSDFSFLVIESLYKLDNIERNLLNREAYWCHQLFTFQPFGLNKRLESNSAHRINYS